MERKISSKCNVYVYIDGVNDLTTTQILREIAKIQRMEIGSLRKRPDGNWNLSTYEYCPKMGKKRTRTEYVSAADYQSVKELISEGDRFCELIEDYLEQIVAGTRGERDAVKKSRKEKRTQSAEQRIKVRGVRANSNHP